MSTQGMPWPAGNASSTGDGYSRGGGYQGNRSSYGSPSGYNQKDKVYVQNIPMSMNQNSVEALFSKCGQVVETKLLAPKDGRNTVSGFIKFTREEAAQEAINKMSGYVIGDSPPLRVMWPKSNTDTQSDGRHRVGGKGNNQGYNRASNADFNGPSPNQHPYGANTVANNSYSQNSQSGKHGNQSSRQANFMSLLGRGENRTVNNSKPPGGLQHYQENRAQYKSYLPLEQLKITPDYPNTLPQQNGYGQPSPPQQYQQQPPSHSYHQQPPSNSYQQQPPSNSYQQQPPSNSYQQQPPSNSYQQQPPSNSYQQPTPQVYQYHYEVPRNGHIQPLEEQNRDHFQPNSYGQPPAPQQGYILEQPPNSYEQPPAPQQGYILEQPPNSYEQPPAPRQAHVQEQPPNSYGQPRAPWRDHFQEQPQSPNSYGEPPAPQRDHFQEQPNSYGEPPAPQQAHIQVQPPNNYGQPPAPQQAHIQEQPPNSYGQPPAPQQAYFQQQPLNNGYQQISPLPPNQEYEQNNTQQYKSWENSMPNQSSKSQASQISWQQRSSGGQRFSKRDKTCNNCKETGHFSRECPNPRSQGGQSCNKCGEVGHFSRECPNASGPSVDQLCHKCGEAGHFARDCTSSSQRGGNSNCHRCGKPGHFAKECPNTPNRGGDSNCYKCGELGHFSRECPNAPNRGGDSNCYRCGEPGHFARECPNASSRDNPSRLPPVTYIPQELPEDMEALFTDMPHSGINFDKYDNIPVKATGHQGQEAPPPINTFDEVKFGSQIEANVRRAGFVKPTPVQKYAFPIAMDGLDLMACAQTGSGKTVAYLLPTLSSIIKNGIPAATQSPLVICMAPTRELVVQIYKEAIKFADGTPIKVAVAYGGVNVAYQLQQLERGCHFLAATPGRLQDFVTRERVYLDGVKYLILDEADRMLDMGFGPAVRKLVQQCNITPKESRQTVMFSATFPNEIQLLAADFLKQDYIFLAVGCVGGSNLDIEQHIIRVDGNDKRNKLFDILNDSGTDRTLVFVELKRVADFLACLLSENNFPTTSISSDRSQQEREAALRDFRHGRANILVATSVAARGLDIPDVKHVVNYDLPQDIEEYVHRIGRTGRIGNKGKATSFFENGRDEKLARSLVKVLSEAFQEVPAWLEQAAEDAIGSSYGPSGGRFASKDHRQGGGRSRRDEERFINHGMANLNLQSEPNSNFGSRSHRQDNQSSKNTIQNAADNNFRPQEPRQNILSQQGGGGGTGDSDDDWD